MWIDLQRVLVLADNPGEVPPQDAWLLALRPRFTWQQILVQPCVVLLGEAGSGKTAELRALAERLPHEGKTAFFLRVEALAEDNVRLATEGDRDALDPWKEGTAEAWFFLDSVDEAKLHKQTLNRALAKLEEDLRGALGRCHVIVSCRHSDWREEDAETMRRLSPKLVPASPLAPQQTATSLVQNPYRLPSASVHILRLAPLNRAQVQAYAEQKAALEDGASFISALDRADLWGLAGRPLDVEWLAGFWKDHHRFDSLREMIDDNISDKLKEWRDSSRFPVSISLEQAREAVERVALALTMTGVESVSLLGAAGRAAHGAVDIRLVLSHLNDIELSSLLRLPIFDPATLGRVRFHHRAVKEFLAAACLRRFSGGSLTTRALEDLLFATVAGRTFIRPGFEPIVAWLALDDVTIRQRALHVAPEHLMDLGDPARLHLDTRREILHGYARRFAGRKRTMHEFDRSGIERFANEDLAADLRDLLASTSPQELRIAILQMIECRKLGSLADVALDVSRETELSPTLRYAAIRAVAVAGTLEQKHALARAMIPEFAKERGTAATLLENLFPSVLTVDHVIEILETAPPRDAFFDDYSRVLESLDSMCPPGLRVEFLTKLTTLSERAFAAKHEGAGAHFEWAPAVVPLLDEALRAGSIDHLMPACCRILKSVREDDHHIVDIDRDLLAGRSALRRALFWHSATQKQSNRGQWPTSANECWPYALFSSSLVDADWLQEDALSRADLRASLLAFDGLVLLCRVRELPLERLKFVAAERPELGRRLHRILNPPWPSAKDLESYKRHEMVMRRHELRRNRTLREHKDALSRLLPEIRSGAAGPALSHLYRVGVADGSTEWSYTAVAERYGSDIADAARDGISNLWDTQSPPAPHEIEHNMTPWVGAPGSLSVTLAVRRGLDVGQIDETKLRRAIVYAAWSPNELPTWLDACAQRAPSLVRDVFATSLRRDWSLEHRRFLPQIASASDGVRSACAPIVLELLEDGDPPHDRCLQESLQVVRGMQAHEKQLFELCRARSVTSVQEPKHFALWWNAWFELDSSEAVSALHDVSSREPRDVADLCVLACFSGQSSERWIDRLDGCAPELVALLGLVLKHVRLDEDVEDFHSPRHDAQQFRWRLIAAVKDTGMHDAIRVLDDLAEREWSKPFWRDWFKHAADECAKRAAAKAWPLREVLEFLGDISARRNSLSSSFVRTEPTTAQPSPSSPTPAMMQLPPSTILHLSDLHFGTLDDAVRWHGQLAEDLRRELSCNKLDAVILSGDIANFSTPNEYAAARDFLDRLGSEYRLAPHQIILVPGNHDLNWQLAKDAYDLRHRTELTAPLIEGAYKAHGKEVVEIRDEARYQRRFEPFARFYEGVRGEPYPLDYENQAVLTFLPSLGILVLGLNSGWEIDHHFEGRASIHPGALAHALAEIRRKPEYDACSLKIAVWHHPVDSAFDDRIRSGAFLEQLAKAGFRLALHGHVHKAETRLYCYDRTPDGRRIDFICAGTFGAPVRQWNPGIPLQYNLLRIQGPMVTVETRKREQINGAWAPDARWLQGAGKRPLAYYNIPLL